MSSLWGAPARATSQESASGVLNCWKSTWRSGRSVWVGKPRSIPRVLSKTARANHRVRGNPAGRASESGWSRAYHRRHTWTKCLRHGRCRGIFGHASLGAWPRRCPATTDGMMKRTRDLDQAGRHVRNDRQQELDSGMEVSLKDGIVRSPPPLPSASLLVARSPVGTDDGRGRRR